MESSDSSIHNNLSSRGGVYIYTNMDSSSSRERPTTSSSNNSSSSSLQLLMYSTLSACILVFTFLAGHYDGERSAENRYLKGGNAALSKRLNDFKNGGSAAAGEKKKDDVLSFTPRLIRKKNDGNHNNKNKKHNKQQEKVWGRGIKVPDDWETWGFYDIHHGLKCGEHANDMDKPLPDMDYWTYYRNVYKNVVDKNGVQFDDPIPPTEGYTLTTNGEKQPYYAKRSPGKGRGLFALRDIKKGEVVHDGTNSDVIMSGKDFRRFLFALPQKMACDATEWVSIRIQQVLGMLYDFTFGRAIYHFSLFDISPSLAMILTDIHTHAQSTLLFHSHGHSNQKRMVHSQSVLHLTFLY